VDASVPREALGKRISVTQGLTALLAAAAVGAGLWALPGRFGTVNREAKFWGGTPVHLRLLQEAAGFELRAGIYPFAAQIIPPTATYAVITGPQAHFKRANAADAVAGFGQLYLLPRMPTDLAHAQYVISYGALLRYGGLDIHFSHIWNFKPGLAVAEIAR